MPDRYHNARKVAVTINLDVNGLPRMSIVKEVSVGDELTDDQIGNKLRQVTEELGTWFSGNHHDQQIPQQR